MATGGLALAAAGGSSVSGRTPVNIHFLDSKVVYQTMADNEVAAALTRVSLKHARTSTGRKPGWGS